MRTVLEGSLLYERAEDGTQSLQFAGHKHDKSGESFIFGALSTIASSATHADWFFTRQFAPRVRITIEPLVEVQPAGNR